MGVFVSKDKWMFEGRDLAVHVHLVEGRAYEAKHADSGVQAVEIQTFRMLPAAWLAKPWFGRESGIPGLDVLFDFCHVYRFAHFGRTPVLVELFGKFVEEFLEFRFFVRHRRRAGA